MITIYQKTSKLIKNIALVAVINMLIATSLLANESYQLSNAVGEKVMLRLALTRQEHAQGLSGIKDSQFPANHGMLFVNATLGPRRFWMPDTYFNLDIIFLNRNLEIVGIEKNVPAHPGRAEPPAIYYTKTYLAQFVLETKANSKFSKNLKVGDKLKWVGSTSLSEIILKTHQMR